MLPINQRNTNIGVGIGILVQIVGNMIMKENPLGLIIALVGVGFFIWGCFNYAKGKGYSQFLGLFGLLWLIGLIILAVLPDKHPQTKN